MSGAWAGAGATVARRRMESREEEKKKPSLETGDALLKKNGEAGRAIIEISIYSLKQTSQWKSLKRRENDLLTN